MRYAVIDTEGSDKLDMNRDATDDDQSRMASFAIILVDDQWQVESERDWLVRPDGWTFDDHSEAAEKNGLTHAQLLADGVYVGEPLRAYTEAIEERRILVGFNTPYDLKQLRGELRRLGWPDRWLQTRYLCIMQGCRKQVDARTEDGRKKAPKLEEACAYYGIDYVDKHKALADARATFQIMLKLRDAGEIPPFKDPYENRPRTRR